MSGALQSWSQALQGLDTNTILTQNDVVNQNAGQLFQGKKANGFYDPELGVIVLGRDMNEVTLPHEMAHYWLDTFFCFANAKIVAPAMNIHTDNNCPMVSPHDVKNPIWASGARNISQNARNTA